MSQSSALRDPYTVITDLIINHLECGVVPWRQPWQRQVGCPRNFHSGSAYQGINVLLLGLYRFASPYWMTFRQVKMHRGFIRKGERGALVVRYGQYEPRQDGIESEEKRARYFLKAYTAFNAAQIEGISFPELPNAPAKLISDRLERAEDLVANMPQPPEIEEGRRARACYHPSADRVEMPAREDFESLEAFYLTLFHELIHATGHPSRLARESLTESDGFGGKVYSQEELVAEMGAAFLGMEADVVHDQHERSAAYLQGWLKVLKQTDHRRWIVQAASRASRATDFVLDRQRLTEEQGSHR